MIFPLTIHSGNDLPEKTDWYYAMNKHGEWSHTHYSANDGEFFPDDDPLYWAEMPDKEALKSHRCMNCKHLIDTHICGRKLSYTSLFDICEDWELE